jgi:hypothetical protein
MKGKNLIKKPNLTLEEYKHFLKDCDYPDFKVHGVPSGIPVYHLPFAVYNGQIEFCNPIVSKVHGFGGFFRYLILENYKDKILFEGKMGDDDKDLSRFISHQLFSLLHKKFFTIFEQDKIEASKFYFLSASKVHFEEQVYPGYFSNYHIKGFCTQDFGAIFIEPRKKEEPKRDYLTKGMILGENAKRKETFSSLETSKLIDEAEFLTGLLPERSKHAEVY